MFTHSTSRNDPQNLSFKVYMNNSNASVDPFTSVSGIDDMEKGSRSPPEALHHSDANTSTILHGDRILNRLSTTTRTSPRIRRSLMDRITRAAQDSTRGLRISGLNCFRVSPSQPRDEDVSGTMPKIHDETLPDSSRALTLSDNTTAAPIHDESAHNTTEKSPAQQPKRTLEDPNELDVVNLVQLSPRISKRPYTARPNTTNDLKDPSPALLPADEVENTSTYHQYTAPMKRARTESPHDNPYDDSLRAQRGQTPDTAANQSVSLQAGEVEVITARLICELNARDSEIATLQAALHENRRNNFSIVEEFRNQLCEMHEHVRKVLPTESPGGIKDLQTLLDRERAIRGSLEKSLKEQLEDFTASQAKARQEAQKAAEELIAAKKLAESRQQDAERAVKSLSEQLEHANSVINTQKQEAEYQSRRYAQLKEELSLERAEKAELIKACNDFLQIEMKHD